MHDLTKSCTESFKPKQSKATAPKSEYHQHKYKSKWIQRVGGQNYLILSLRYANENRLYILKDSF